MGGKWVDMVGEKFGEVINLLMGEVIVKVLFFIKEDVVNVVEIV